MNKKENLHRLNNFQETHLNEIYNSTFFSVILVKPEHAGNIGSVSRLMSNFNFKDLIIFNPIETVERIFANETYGFAMHGKDILSEAKIITIDNQENHYEKLKDYLSNFDLIIATTAKGKRYTNIKRLAIFPDDLIIPNSKKPLNIAILFGSESHGLTNEEIGLADIILRIPTSDPHPTLNLSHSCAIILYEIFKKINLVSIGRGEKPVILADKEDRLLLYKIIKNLIKILKLRTYKEDNVFQAFKNVIERSIVSKKEFSLMVGLFSRIESILRELKLYEKK